MFWLVARGARFASVWKKKKNNNSEKRKFSRFAILLNIYYDYELNYSQKAVTDTR